MLFSSLTSRDLLRPHAPTQYQDTADLHRNDDVSAITLPAGLHVTVYSDSMFVGTQSYCNRIGVCPTVVRRD